MKPMYVATECFFYYHKNETSVSSNFSESSIKLRKIITLQKYTNYSYINFNSQMWTSPSSQHWKHYNTSIIILIAFKIVIEYM